MFRSWVWLFIVACAFWTPAAWGHRYIHNDGSHQDADRALDVGDIAISTVVYHEEKDGAQQLWLSFDTEADQRISIQLGVPYIDRYSDLRPAFALLGEGMAPVDLPFDIPEGYGGVVYTTDDITAPETFNEEFTGTKSWVFEMQHIDAPETGRYYIVGFVPSGAPGKYWIAPGTREYFGVRDILSLPYVIYQVRTFHEIFPFGGILAWGLFGIITTIVVLLVG